MLKCVSVSECAWSIYFFSHPHFFFWVGGVCRYRALEIEFIEVYCRKVKCGCMYFGILHVFTCACVCEHVHIASLAMIKYP